MLKATVNDWLEDKALRLSAALAYYSIFSIAPLLIIAVTIAGAVLGPEAVRGQLDDQLKIYIGDTSAAAVQSMVQSASKPSDGIVGGLIGFAALFLGASGIFAQLKDALNTIWEVRLKPGGGIKAFVRERLLSFGMVLVIGFLLLTSLLASTALAAFNGYIGRALGVPPVVLGIFGFLLSFSVVTTLFAFIFKVLPDAEIEWRHVWIGAAITALLFEIGKVGLSIYLGRESTASSFGAAGSIVLLLLWVYYTSCILFFGAEFTQVYARATGHVIRPAHNAVAVAGAERTREGPPPPELSWKPMAATRVTPTREGASSPVELFSASDGHFPAPAIPEPGKKLRHSPTFQLAVVTAATFVLGLLLNRRVSN